MYKGKAIYQPAGKAKEYARWACNYYVGCSNDCDYCYCKKGVLSSVAGGKEAALKACFRDKQHAFETFVYEMTSHVTPRMQRYMLVRKEGGLFFSFTTDPCLPETIDLTILSVMFATGLECPCQVLTKCARWVQERNIIESLQMVKDRIAVGFTLTGMDLQERGPTVSSNAERLGAMLQLHEMGFKTFASIEPVINIDKAVGVIEGALGVCDMMKVGLLSGNAKYDIEQLREFVGFVNEKCEKTKTPVYWKKSIRERIEDFPECAMCVGSDYNIFEQ